jgi:hypothetical protein
VHIIWQGTCGLPPPIKLKSGLMTHTMFLQSKIQQKIFNKTLVVYLQMLLFDFSHHNIEMVCALLESCGRFLYRSQDSHHRTRVYLVCSYHIYPLVNFTFVIKWRYIIVAYTNDNKHIHVIFKLMNINDIFSLTTIFIY